MGQRRPELARRHFEEQASLRRQPEPPERRGNPKAPEAGARGSRATGKFGIVFFLLYLPLAGYIVHRHFQHGKAIQYPWP